MSDIRISFARYENDVEEKYGPITGNTDVLSIFTSSFMKQHTKYNSIFDFIDAAGLKNEQKGWEQLQSGSVDSFIKDNSEFESWADMKETAIAYYENKLNK